MDKEEFFSNYSKIMALKPNVYFTKIPLLMSYTDDVGIIKSDVYKKIMQTIHNNKKILDIGAGNRNFKDLLDTMGLNYIYRSLDIDKTNTHDFHSIEEINEKFDYVLLFNLLEHLSFETGLKYLSKAQDILENSGSIIIAIPNIWHPNHMWRCDITHTKPYPYQDLYALLTFMGFREIEMFRIYHRPFKLSIKKFILNKLKILLHEIMEMDYAKDFLIIAKKKI
jgi:predicted SAM-dependent methyltransferase